MSQRSRETYLYLWRWWIKRDTFLLYINEYESTRLSLHSRWFLNKKNILIELKFIYSTNKRFRLWIFDFIWYYLFNWNFWFDFVFFCFEFNEETQIDIRSNLDNDYVYFDCYFLFWNFVWNDLIKNNCVKLFVSNRKIWLRRFRS